MVQLHNIDVSDYFYSMPSYKIKDEICLSGIPDEMTNFAYSSLTFAESTESIVTFRSQLIICRGTLKNKEVVIIDKDFNRVVSSDEVLSYLNWFIKRKFHIIAHISILQR